MKLPKEIEKKLMEYKGKKIVEEYKKEMSSKWIQDCIKKGCFIDDEDLHNYLLPMFFFMQRRKSRTKGK